jgi:hypothetical protein
MLRHWWRRCLMIALLLRPLVAFARVHVSTISLCGFEASSWSDLMALLLALTEYSVVRGKHR